MSGLRKLVNTFLLSSALVLGGCSARDKLPPIETITTINSNTNIEIRVSSREMSRYLAPEGLEKIPKKEVYLVFDDGTFFTGTINPYKPGISFPISSSNLMYGGELFSRSYKLIIADAYNGQIETKENRSIPASSDLLLEAFKTQKENLLEQNRKDPLKELDLSTPRRGASYSAEATTHLENLAILTGGDTNKLNAAWKNYLQLNPITNKQ